MDETESGERSVFRRLAPRSILSSLKPYLWAFVCIVVVTVIGKLLDPFFDRVNIALLYLLPVLVSAVRWGRGPSFFASFLGVLTFDFLFVPPFFQLCRK